MHEELKDAIAKVQRVAKENKIRSGIYATSGDQAKEFGDQGFQMVSWPVQRNRSSIDNSMQVSVVADMVALPAYMTSALTAARGSYVHSTLNMTKGAVSGAAETTGPYGR